MEFSNDEKLDMLFVYARCMRNQNDAVEIYTDLYPGRRIPNARYFAKLERHLREYGCFNKPKNRSTTVTLEGGEGEINVLGKFILL